MVADYHDEMVCDLAQYYHIYDWRTYPARLIATYVAGLPPESRTVMAVNHQRPIDIYTLLASIGDILSVAHGGKPWLMDILTGEKVEEESHGYESAEDFREARAKLIERMQHG